VSTRLADVATAASAEDLAAVRALFREYAASPDVAPNFPDVLARQGFERELATLPGAYAPPRGVLLLARVAGEPAGCVACRPLAERGVCEMKRLYVRPAFRAAGLGRALVERVVAEAARVGYARMRLDTLPSMTAAQRLYRALGFRDIPPYGEPAAPGAVFLERALGPH
jgi:ribosomal protein S18 acetylase RimI-like enzyme